MRSVRTWLSLLACLVILVSNLPLAYAQNPAQDEPLLKAAYVYNFAKFTRWPAGTWSGQEDPMGLCIAGRDELASGLERLAGKIIMGHPVAVRSAEDPESNVSCHLLYIATSEKNRYSSVLRTLRSEPVLTISEIPGFANSGGMIELYGNNDRIHFKINPAVVRSTGLTLSSRLLRLARLVADGEAP